MYLYVFLYDLFNFIRVYICMICIYIEFALCSIVLKKITFLNEFESQQAVLIPVSSKFIQTSGDSGSFTSANGSWNLILSEKGLIYFLVINIFGVILPGCVSVSDTYKYINISHWTLTMCIQHKNTKHHSRFQLRLFVQDPFYSFFIVVLQKWRSDDQRSKNPLFAILFDFGLIGKSSNSK